MSIMSENIGYGYHTMSGADKSETDVIRARTPCAEKKRTLRTTNRRREKRKNAYTADRRYGKNTGKRGTHEQRTCIGIPSCGYYILTGHQFRTHTFCKDDCQFP